MTQSTDGVSIVLLIRLAGARLEVLRCCGERAGPNNSHRTVAALVCDELLLTHLVCVGQLRYDCALTLLLQTGASKSRSDGAFA